LGGVICQLPKSLVISIPSLILVEVSEMFFHLRAQVIKLARDFVDLTVCLLKQTIGSKRRRKR